MHVKPWRAQPSTTTTAKRGGMLTKTNNYYYYYYYYYDYYYYCCDAVMHAAPFRSMLESHNRRLLFVLVMHNFD